MLAALSKSVTHTASSSLLPTVCTSGWRLLLCRYAAGHWCLAIELHGAPQLAWMPQLSRFHTHADAAAGGVIEVQSQADYDSVMKQLTGDLAIFKELCLADAYYLPAWTDAHTPDVCTARCWYNMTYGMHDNLKPSKCCHHQHLLLAAAGVSCRCWFCGHH
jgi:hypothetical protein